jgi:hypothetical protein
MMAPERVLPSWVEAAEPPKSLARQPASLRIWSTSFLSSMALLATIQRPLGSDAVLGGSPVDVIASSLSVSGW